MNFDQFRSARQKKRAEMTPLPGIITTPLNIRGSRAPSQHLAGIDPAIPPRSRSTPLPVIY